MDILLLAFNSCRWKGQISSYFSATENVNTRDGHGLPKPRLIAVNWLISE